MENAAEISNFMNKLYPQNSSRSTLADAKARLNIHALWQHFNLSGDSRKNPCHCPWREDRKASLSISPDGTVCNDFSTGEAGDQIWFFQRITGLPQKDACRKFIELAGGQIASAPRTACPRPQPAEAKPKPSFPDFRIGTADELNQLARLRHIGREGLDWASERGLLRFATLKNCPAWIATDSEQFNAQARRLDGQPWEHIQAKAWTLPGAWASWPIGITEARDFRAIALCEGGPDFLAGHYLSLWEQATHHTQRDGQCSPVAMLGASQRIHTDALPMFTGKRVRIFGHDDEAGRGAVERWAAQLATVGADVDAFSFAGLRQMNGQAVKDLNDSLLMDAGSFAQVERMLP